MLCSWRYRENRCREVSHRSPSERIDGAQGYSLLDTRETAWLSAVPNGPAAWNLHLAWTLQNPARGHSQRLWAFLCHRIGCANRFPAQQVILFDYSLATIPLTEQHQVKDFLLIFTLELPRIHQNRHSEEHPGKQFLSQKSRQRTLEEDLLEKHSDHG